MNSIVVQLNHVQQHAWIDETDEALVTQYVWRTFCTRGIWYAYAARRRPRIYMHRLIMDAQQGMEVDHRDGDGLNNRRDNLRVCTHAQNLANQRKNTTNTSGYRGVVWYKRDSVWVAQTKHKGKPLYLGRFTTAEDAARAYDEKVLEIYGEFAQCNFSQPSVP